MKAKRRIPLTALNLGTQLNYLSQWLLTDSKEKMLRLIWLNSNHPCSALVVKTVGTRPLKELGHLEQYHLEKRGFFDRKDRSGSWFLGLDNLHNRRTKNSVLRCYSDLKTPRNSCDPDSDSVVILAFLISSFFIFKTFFESAGTDSLQTHFNLDTTLHARSGGCL